MSCKSNSADAALQLCTDVLAAREEFCSDYGWLENVKANKTSSSNIDKFFNRTFNFTKYDLTNDSWKPKVAEVDVLQILRKRKLNHEVEAITLATFSNMCFCLE